MEEDADCVSKKVGNGHLVDIQDNRKLKPLPAALLARMLHSTNSSKFEFMDGGTNSNNSSRASTRSSRPSSSRQRKTPPRTPPGDMAHALEGMEPVDIVEAHTETLPRNPHTPSSELGSEPINSGASTARSDGAQPDVLDCKNDAHNREAQQTPPNLEELEEPDVQTGGNGVCFDVPCVESPRQRRPPSDLMKRLTKKTPGAPKKPRKDNADQPAEKPVRKKPLVKRAIKEQLDAAETLEEEGQLEIGQAAGTPPRSPPLTSRSITPPSAIPIGVGVGIEDVVPDSLPEPESLSEDDRFRCTEWVKLLGLSTVKGLLSSRWQHRSDAIAKVAAYLEKYGNAKPAFRQRLYEVGIEICETRLLDNVLQVYIACTDLCRSLLLSAHSLDLPKVRPHVVRLIPTLLKRAGDGNQRLCSAAEQLIMWIAADTQLDGVNVVAEFITQPVLDTKAYKHVVARLKIITSIVNGQGFIASRESGLSAENVSLFVLNVVESSNRRVCKDASEVLLLLYQRLGMRCIHLLNVQVKDNASEDFLQRAIGPLVNYLLDPPCEGVEGPTKNQRSDALLALAMHDKIGAGFIGKFATQPPDDMANVASLVGRLETVSRLVSQIGFQTGGLPAQTVMLFAMNGVQNIDVDVNKAATDLVIAAHRKCGDEIWNYMVQQDSECFINLKKRVIQSATRSSAGRSSLKAKLAVEVGFGRSRNHAAFGGKPGK